MDDFERDPIKLHNLSTDMPTMAIFLLSRVSHQQMADGRPSSSKSSEMQTRSSVGHVQSDEAEIDEMMWVI